MRKKYERHGHAGNGRMTPTYRSWRMMINRCHNPNTEDYKYYGALGVVVCDQWRESYQAFVDHAGERPPGKTIDRWPDKTGNYEPGNVRWATNEEQGRNTQRNYVVTFDGETKPLSAWCDQLGLKYGTVYRRLTAYDWPVEAAFEVEHNWQYRAKNMRPIEIGCFIGSINEWCDGLKLNKSMIAGRINRGATPQEALGY